MNVERGTRYRIDSYLIHSDQSTSSSKSSKRSARNDPRIRRIQTIPGVGPRTAEILVACIDDPHRFENGRQVSAYFGLVPRQYQSGETDRNGRITKRGNPLARTILVNVPGQHALQPVGQRSLRADLWQAEDSQEEGRQWP